MKNHDLSISRLSGKKGFASTGRRFRLRRVLGGGIFVAGLVILVSAQCSIPVSIQESAAQRH